MVRHGLRERAPARLVDPSFDASDPAMPVSPYGTKVVKILFVLHESWQVDPGNRPLFCWTRCDSGVYDWPGGKADIGKGDRCLEDTTLREFDEELDATRLWGWREALCRRLADGKPTIHKVTRPDGSADYVHYWVVPLPQSDSYELWSSMCDDLDGYLMEPDKHACAIPTFAPLVKSSQRYARARRPNTLWAPRSPWAAHEPRADARRRPSPSAARVAARCDPDQVVAVPQQ